MNATQDIMYRPRGDTSRSLRIGAHRSRGVGSLGGFRDQVPFLVHPDTRRVDVKATLRDPFETTIVRRLQQHVSIDLYAIVDLSRSLRFEGRASKRDLVTDLCATLARSATRGGDRFGLVGCDSGVNDACFVPASRRRSVVIEVESRLAAMRFDGETAEGLRTVGQRLLGARKMVFLISDFLLPLSLVRATFEGLARHDVVPVVLADTSEDVELPDWGFLELTDLETRRSSLTFMRPRLKQRWLDAERSRRGEIRKLAAGFGRTPITIANVLDVDAFSRQLMES